MLYFTARYVLALAANAKVGGKGCGSTVYTPPYLLSFACGLRPIGKLACGKLVEPPFEMTILSCGAALVRLYRLGKPEERTIVSKLNDGKFTNHPCRARDGCERSARQHHLCGLELILGLNLQGHRPTNPRARIERAQVVFVESKGDLWLSTFGIARDAHVDGVGRFSNVAHNRDVCCCPLY